MKVLVTSFTYAPRRDGVQFVTEYLCEGLVARGHEVTVITEQHPGLPTYEIINGVRIKRWPVFTRHLHHYGPKKEYINYILDNQDSFDVMVNVGTQTPFTDWLLPYIRKIHIPKILHIHSIWDFEIHPWDRSSLMVLLKKLLANAKWREYYAYHAKAFKAYNCVVQLYTEDYSVQDFDKWYGIKSQILENAAEDAFHLDIIPQCQRRKSVICVANFNILKNQSELVDAFLKSSVPDDWELDLIGSLPSYELDVAKRIEASDRNKLQLTGNMKRIRYFVGIDRLTTVQMVKTASVYAMSSKREAFPISLVEAMSAGIPWISTDVGIARYLPGGIVVRDVNGLSKALSNLCFHANIRSRLGKEGYDYAAKHFRINDKVSQFESMLKNVIDGGSYER